MFQVFARESVKYYHVFSPRYTDRPYWGATFPDRDTCQQACDDLYAREFPRFWIAYPREIEHPQENYIEHAHQS